MKQNEPPVDIWQWLSRLTDSIQVPNRLSSVVAILSGVLLWRAVVANYYYSRIDKGEILPGIITSEHVTLLTLLGLIGLSGVITIIGG